MIGSGENDYELHQIIFCAEISAFGVSWPGGTKKGKRCCCMLSSVIRLCVLLLSAAAPLQQQQPQKGTRRRKKYVRQMILWLRVRTASERWNLIIPFGSSCWLLPAQHLQRVLLPCRRLAAKMIGTSNLPSVFVFGMEPATQPARDQIVFFSVSTFAEFGHAVGGAVAEQK